MGRPSPSEGGGYRVAVKMETSIKLICHPFGQGHSASLRLDSTKVAVWPTAGAAYDTTTTTQVCTATQKNDMCKPPSPYAHAYTQASPLLGWCYYYWSGEQTGELARRLGRISQEATHGQTEATAWLQFIVLGFPEQGLLLSLGFMAFAANECPFYNYNAHRPCPLFPHVWGCSGSFYKSGQRAETLHALCFTLVCAFALMIIEDMHSTR